jgi:acetylornithine deacetylase/succinyl-diaminopimelate desuccinylase-like protein
MAIFSPADARRAVERGFDDAVDFLAELVRVPSLLGEEEPAQQLVEARMRELGFEVESVIPALPSAWTAAFRSCLTRAGVPLWAPSETAAAHCS